MDTARTLRRPDASLGVVFAVVLAPFLLDDLFRRELYAHSTLLFWLFDFLKFVVFPTAAIVYLARVHGIWPRHYGMGSLAEQRWGRLAGQAIFLALLLGLLYYATLYLSRFTLRWEPGPTFNHEINATGLFRIPVTIYLAITPGFVEEVFFRALPLLFLERRFPGQVPIRSYVVATAALFGLIHWGDGVPEVLATFVFGVGAAVLYLRLRNLWPLIAAHIIVDLVDFA